ncbi:MAG: vWA domain-containing protein [Lentimonas sp.]
MNKLLKYFSGKRLLAVICISLFIHLFIGFFYGGVVLFEKFNPPEPELVAPPIPQGIEPRKKEYKIKMEKSQKSSSAPLPVPIVANIPSDLSLENIDLNVSTPRSEQKIRGAGSGDGVGKGFGDGFGEGGGMELDIDIEFFGAKGGGGHVAFVIDYSGSMAGSKEAILRRETMRIMKDLPEGVQFGVIFFAGPAWPASKSYTSGLSNWVTTTSPGSPYTNFRPKNWGRLPEIKYETSSMTTRKRYMRIAEDTPLVLGTIYDVPLYMAMTMDPVPETIFFMTDGACPQSRGIVPLKKMIAQLKAAGKKVPIIHTVGLGNNNSQLQAIAKLTGGTSTFLTPQQYVKQYGPGRVDIPGKGENVLQRVDKVPAKKYPVEFNLNDKK